MRKFYSHFIFLLLAIFALNFSVLSQTFSISGIVSDSVGTPLFGASVVLKVAGDPSNPILTGTATDSTGNFTFLNVSPGTYILKFVNTGYRPTGKKITVNDSSVFIGNIILKYSGVVLEGVDINDKQIRMTQNGDTTGFNTNAYKTHADATAEDLVNKLPGVTNENGTIKVNGEEVKQVLVDGKPFFGEDPNAALKNLPADMVDKVQVYDKASDQSQFTGFDDGQSKKTLNLVTKKNNMNGKFGKIYAGYGTDGRYNCGTTLNSFDNAQRISILGMSNNINQQNFSMQDLFGATGGSGGSGRPMMMRGGGGPGGSFRGGGSMGNFSVGQQNGITQTTAFGINYSDEWGKKIKVSGSYFFNTSFNQNNTNLSRTYFTTLDSALFYNEENNATTSNMNHRFNFRFEYTIDSMNALLINSKFTSQFTDYSKRLDGLNYSDLDSPESSIYTSNSSKNLGFTMTNGATFRHRFKKPSRTISLDASVSNNPRTGTGSYFSYNRYSNDTTLDDQHSSLSSDGYTLSSTLAWTEPVGKSGQFLFSYAPSMTKNKMDKQTNNFDFAGNDFTLVDTALTNLYENTYFTQRAGISYRYKGTKATLIVGSDFQYAVLSGNEKFPSITRVDKTFQNILPNANFNYKFSQGKNLKIIYRTTTVSPTITQLQDVIDNSNPLQLKTGNPNLSQDFEQTLIAHYGKTNAEKATGFFAFFYAQFTTDYIANSTTIATNDTTIAGIFLNRGSQLTQYVNMSGYRTARSFLTYSFALTKLKCNLSFNGSLGYSHTPSMIDGIRNDANNTNLGPGLTLSSNMSEKFDFTLSYNGSFYLITNSIQKQSNDNYFSHTASFKFNCMPYKGIVLNTSLDQTFYNGLGKSYNTNYLLWNASIGYKFLKNKTLEAKISAFDILGQNTSVARTVSDTYIEDSQSNALPRYFMLTVTYNIKKFNKQEAPAPVPAPQK